MQLEVQLALPTRHFVAGLGLHLRFGLGEEVVGMAVLDLRQALEVTEAALAQRHLANRAAAAVAVAEQQDAAVGQVLVLVVALHVGHVMRRHVGIVLVGRREVREDLRAVDTLPHEGVVRQTGGVVPAELLGEEPRVARALGDLRPGAGVAEAVGQPDAVRLDAELLPEIALAVADLPDQ